MILFTHRRPSSRPFRSLVLLERNRKTIRACKLSPPPLRVRQGITYPSVRMGMAFCQGKGRERWIGYSLTDPKRLVELRDNWLNPAGASEADLKKRTLTNLYNARPAWLANAHAALDRAVLAAYGWPHDLADDDLLARLLALNAERASEQVSAAPRPS